MGVFANISSFNEKGDLIDAGMVTLPDYLDWMPIAPKVFWFRDRGYGHPDATHVLFESQGERYLLSVNKSLSFLKHTEIKEREHGIEKRVQRYIEENGICRTPRNQ